jgi:hypothetical protein
VKSACLRLGFICSDELRLKQNQSNAPEARHCFERAIEVARKQSAKPVKLRATVSLARLFPKQGRRDEARVMLAKRLVHRGIRHRRPQRWKGAARRTEA